MPGRSASGGNGSRRSVGPRPHPDSYPQSADKSGLTPEPQWMLSKDGPQPQGEVMGHAGTTGLAAGPHSHYKVPCKRGQVDPLSIKMPSAGIARQRRSGRVSGMVRGHRPLAGRTVPGWCASQLPRWGMLSAMRWRLGGTETGSMLHEDLSRDDDVVGSSDRGFGLTVAAVL